VLVSPKVPEPSQMEDVSAAMRRRLLAWFPTHRRDFPWRHNVSPYSVWISEIMLQQTVVKTVIPFFKHWLRRFPDVAAISSAREQEILTQWEGLGYYGRARNIHRAARLIMQLCGGQLPNTYEELLKLPGIGEYTAAAIMSIAFGEPHLAVDTNVRRVASRILALQKRDATAEEQLRSLLTRAMPPKRAGLFNEAVMELGQTVCLSRKPLCEACPLESLCLTRQRNLPKSISSGTPNRVIEKQSVLLLLISQGRILAKRKEGGLFAGLWLLPTFRDDARVETAIAGFVRPDKVIEVSLVGTLSARTHHYTNHAERLRPLVYRIRGKGVRSVGDWRWLRLANIESYPFPSVYRRILSDLRETPDG